MEVIFKIFRRLGFYAATIISKIRWKGLSVEGLFRKRRDTEIIITDNGVINIGKNVLFKRNVSLATIGGTLDIGKDVFFNRNCLVMCRKEITIGDKVLIGPGVTIYDHDHIFSNEGILEGYKEGPVIIDNDCWIGANVTILRNTHIGEGCVIGAGAVVKGDIPPHSLVKCDRTLSIVPIEEKQRQEE